MNKLYYILPLLIVFIFSSCSSYKKINSKRFNKFNTIDTYNVADFNIFTFNICESYHKDVGATARFEICPSNFHEVSSQNKIKKVEELYLLKHKNSDLIIYMTTFSHKYIRNQKGFLNDSLSYKNKLYLRDTEYIYVGKVDSAQNSIQYKKQKKGSDMIWHLSESIETNQIIKIKEVNIETIENKGNFDKKIPLNKVFSIPFDFKLSNYELLNKRSKNKSEAINKIYFIKNKKNKIEVVFEMSNTNGGYRFPSRKVIYYTQKLN